MKKRISTQSHLEELVAELVAKHPLPEKPLALGEMEKWEVVQKSPCLFWDMGKTNKGYGVIYFNGRQVLAHRWAYQISYQKRAGSMLVCHACDNPSCVNPHHLCLGTYSENNQDCVNKGRAGDRSVYGDRNGSRTHPEKRMRGEANPASKLREEDVEKIRSIYLLGQSTWVGLAKQFGVSPRTVGNIVSNKTWRPQNHTTNKTCESIQNERRSISN